ncbi:unnamed protein product [Rangifer tarandus platyrhynchus]|uniref:Uncharacterized protein n=1 Tax=Rangifer tarandus platyrhynchus TaxID=3082113 RepID=A0AC59YZU2_RANTA
MEDLKTQEELFISHSIASKNLDRGLVSERVIIKENFYLRNASAQQGKDLITKHMFSFCPVIYLPLVFFFFLIWLRRVLAVAHGHVNSSCGIRMPKLQHAGSSSLTRGQTCPPCIGSTVS